jgi:predicted ABC-class ATPase
MGIPRSEGWAGDVVDVFRLMALRDHAPALSLVVPADEVDEVDVMDVVIHVHDHRRNDVREIRQNVRNNVPDGYKNVHVRRTPRAVVDADMLRHVYIQMIRGGPAGPAPAPL